MSYLIRRNKVIFFLGFIALLLTVVFFIFPIFSSNHYDGVSSDSPRSHVNSDKKKKELRISNFVKTPEVVKGIYMTSWIAGRRDLRTPLISLIENTELNSIVIDIKDYSGKVFFKSDNEVLLEYDSIELRGDDMVEFINELHKKNIYVIGRLAVFQDENFVKKRPDLAVKNKNGDKIWKDRKKISWIDPGSREYWDYIVLIAKESRKVGFDEINFDYIRFPSDGDMGDISFPFSSSTPRNIVISNFFEYLQKSLSGTGLKISADLFGMVTTSKDDMGIGQILEDALPYFDYISPMVYPSHYSEVFENIQDPESNPYQTVYLSMSRAIERAKIASSSSDKFRPWLQDFSINKKYSSKEVRDQIKAVYDTGLNSWLLWSASNRYTKDALENH